MIKAIIKPLTQILDESTQIRLLNDCGPGILKSINHPRSSIHSLSLPMSSQYYGRDVFIQVRNDYSKNSPSRTIYEVFHNKTDIVRAFLAYDCWFNWIDEGIKDRVEYLSEELFEI